MTNSQLITSMKYLSLSDDGSVSSRKLMTTPLNVCYQQYKQRCFIVFHFSISSWYRKKSDYDSVFISSLLVICSFTSTVGFVSLHILIVSENAEFMSSSVCHSFPLFSSTPSIHPVLSSCRGVKRRTWTNRRWVNTCASSSSAWRRG